MNDVTQRIGSMPGMQSGTLGMAGEDKAGPSVKIVVVPFWQYILVDVLAFSYVTGWITASAFWGAGQFEAHGLTPQSSPVDVLLYISRQALIPGGILAMKDLSVWLLKRRQAHGLT